jgi:hypothetical protein
MNPAFGDAWTNINRAQQYIDQGRAVWCNKPDGRLAIKFLRDHPVDAKVRASTPTPDWDGSDRRGIPATLEEQQNVPLMNVRLPMRQRPQSDARGRRRRRA